MRTRLIRLKKWVFEAIRQTFPWFFPTHGTHQPYVRRQELADLRHRPHFIELEKRSAPSSLAPSGALVGLDGLARAHGDPLEKHVPSLRRTLDRIEAGGRDDLSPSLLAALDREANSSDTTRGHSRIPALAESQRHELPVMSLSAAPFDFGMPALFQDPLQLEGEGRARRPQHDPGSNGAGGGGGGDGSSGGGGGGDRSGGNQDAPQLMSSGRTSPSMNFGDVSAINQALSLLASVGTGGAQTVVVAPGAPSVADAISNGPDGVPGSVEPGDPLGDATPENRVNVPGASLYGGRQTPLVFEANRGQTDPSVDYVARGQGYELYLTSTQATLALIRPQTDVPVPQGDDTTATVDYVGIQFVGANANATAEGLDRRSGTVNYLIGNDTSKWATDISTFAKVQYHNVYEGIDLVYYTNSQNELEYDWIINSGADVSAVKLLFSGATSVQLNDSGSLDIKTEGGTLVQKAPIAYQLVDGVRQSVDVGYVQDADGGVSLRVGAYDNARTLIIDPSVTYATYLGGSSDDFAQGVAVDSSGNTYVTGYTISTDFPPHNAYQASRSGTMDGFVTKYDSSGSVVYSTYIGGSSVDRAFAIAVDSSGRAYITGDAYSNDLPLTMGAFQTTRGAGADSYVLRLNAAGSAVDYGTLLAGNGDDKGFGIALDGSNNIYVTGNTGSTNFPNTGATQASNGGGADAFLIRINSSGTSADFSTYLGGSDFDEGRAVAVNSAGTAIFITGVSFSSNLPTTVNALQGTKISGVTGHDGFYAKYTYTSSTLGSSYISFTSAGGGYGIAVDSSDRPYIVGYVNVDNYVTTNPMQSLFGNAPNYPGKPWPGADAFVARVNAAGTAYDYNTYLGGSGSDGALSVAVDSSGNAYVTGNTTSSDFPGTESSSYSGGWDGFLAKINSDGSALIHASYFGGSGDDTPTGIALDSSDNPYVAGYTTSTDFATESPAQGSNGGGTDAFVTGVSGLPTTAAAVSIAATTANAYYDGLVPGVFTISRTGGDSSQPLTVYYAVSGTATNGVDYQTLLGRVVIPAGESSVTLNVTPAISLYSAATKTVTVTVSASPGYKRSTTNDTVTINYPSVVVTSAVTDPIQGVLTSVLAGAGKGVVDAAISALNGMLKTFLNLGVGSASMDCGCGNRVSIPTITFAHTSTSASARPTISGTYKSIAANGVPTKIQTRLTWNGTAQAWKDAPTPALAAGALYQVTDQVDTAVTAGGNYDWTFEVKAFYSGGVTDTPTAITGTTPVQVNDGTNPFGKGWSLAGLDSLIISAAGIVMNYGVGGVRWFLDPVEIYNSPPNDFGLLVKNEDDTFTYTEKDGTKRNFTTTGELSTVVTTDGLTTTYNYGSGLLTSINNPDASTTTFTYNVSDQLTNVTAPGNRVTTFSWNGSGEISSVALPDGSLRTFSYNAAHQITSDQHGPVTATYTYDAATNALTAANVGGATTTIVAQTFRALSSSIGPSGNVGTSTDALGRVTTYTFDSLGRMTQLKTPDGATQTWVLDHAGNPLKYTDGNNISTTYVYNATGDLTSIVTPAGTKQFYEYDSTFHNVTQFRDELGRITTFTYDPTTGSPLTVVNALGQVTSMTWSNGLMQTSVDALGRTTTYIWDSTHRLLTAVVDPLGNRTSYTYTAAGKQSTVTDALGRVTTMTYDGLQRLLTTTDADGGVTSLSYNALGQVLTVTDPLGRVTSFAYDAHGWQTLVTEVVGSGQQRTTTTAYDAVGNVLYITNPLGQVTSFAYDGADRQIRMIEAAGTALARTTTTAYDTGGRLRSVTDPRGTVTSYVYDVRNWTTRVIEAQGTGLARTTTLSYDLVGNLTNIADPRGINTAYGYDALNRMVTTRQASGTSLARTTTTTYDAVGNVLSVKDPAGVTTSYSYDAMDRVTRQIDAQAGSLARTTTIVYDAVGNTLSMTNPVGVVTSFAYDALNRQTRVIEAQGTGLARTTTYVYDAESNLTSVTNPLGIVTSFAYDALNRQTQQIQAYGDSLQRTQTTVYDIGDNVLSFTDARSLITSFSYDGLNRQVTQVEAFGTALARTSTTVYDAGDLVTQSINPRGYTTTYAYDALGRMVTVTDALAGVSTLIYDADDNVTTSIDALGRRTTYTFDNLNRVSQVQDALGNLSTTGYDAVDNVTLSIDALGRRTTYTYDALRRLTVVKDALSNTATTVYDANDRVTTSIDALGRRTTYTYDSLDRTIQVQDALAGLWTTSYDANDNVTGSIDALGRRTTYTYDALDRQTQIQDPLSGLWTTTYDANDNVTTSIDALGRRTTYAYDSLNRVESVKDALGNVSTSIYDANSNVATSIDALGRRTTYSYDALDRLITMKDALGNVSTNVYDVVGNATTSIDALGRRTTFTFDALNRNTQVEDALNGLSTVVFDTVGNQTASIDALGRRTTYGYDALNRVESMKDALGNVTTSVYDAVGNQTVSIDALARRTTYSYDALNRLVTIKDALANVSTNVYDAVSNQTVAIDALARRTTFAYDTLDRLITTTDALGNVSTSAYDAVSNQTVDIDALGNRTTIAYDALDRQVTVTDPLGFVSTTSYDAVGNTLTFTNPRGNTTTYTYDALNRQAQVKDALGSLFTTTYDAVGNPITDVDARGNTSTYTYDALDRNTEVTDALGHTTTSVFDAVGNVIRSIDALGFVTTIGYDSIDRAVTVKTSSGGVTTTVFDTVGDRTSVTNPMGEITTSTYDALHREVTTTDPRGSVTTYVFDAVGNRINLIDPDGNKSTFTFDALNRQVTETDPLAKTITYTFDAIGRQTSKTDRTGRLITYGYDANSQQTGETWKDSGGSVVNTFTMTYDQNANQLTASKDGATITMTYDALDRVATRQDLNTLATFTYDAVGNRTKVQDSFGATTTSVYNAVNLLTSRQLNDGTNTLREDFTYTNRDQTALASRYSDLAGSTLVGTTSFIYDAQGRITHQQFFDGSSTNLAEYTYTYDLANRITSENLNGTIKTYTYDAASQLTNDGTTAYTYDANGNRTMSGYTIGAGNRSLASPGATYTYDNEGNVTGKTDSTGTWAYSYDNQNQLAGATQTSATSLLLTQATYAYDALGNMASKSVYTQNSGLTTLTKFAADVSGQTWADLTSGGSLTTRYVVGESLDSKYARADVGGVSWLLTDRLGSVRDIANGSGAVVAHVDRDGYGNVTVSSGSGFGEYGFVGQRSFAEVFLLKSDGSGRWYDPTVGRWIEEDSIRWGGGDTNLMRYVGNDPTNHVDPKGTTGPHGKPLVEPIPVQLRAIGFHPDDADILNKWWEQLPEEKRGEYSKKLKAATGGIIPTAGMTSVMPGQEPPKDLGPRFITVTKEQEQNALIRRWYSEGRKLPGGNGGQPAQGGGVQIEPWKGNGQPGQGGQPGQAQPNCPPGILGAVLGPYSFKELMQAGKYPRLVPQVPSAFSRVAASAFGRGGLYTAAFGAGLIAGWTIGTYFESIGWYDWIGKVTEWFVNDSGLDKKLKLFQANLEDRLREVKIENWDQTHKTWRKDDPNHNAGVLRKNLGIGPASETGLDAHHIVQSTSNKTPEFQKARDLLLEHQIDINSASNGVSLRTTKPGKPEPKDPNLRVHKGGELHTKIGGQRTYARLEKAVDRAGKDWGKQRRALIEELAKMRQEIIEGTFP